MKFQWNVRNYSAIILILLFFLNDGYGQATPSIPCPDLFQYRYDGSEWFGIIELRSLPLGQTLRLNVHLSLRERLPTTYAGSLELLYSREQTLKNIVQNKPIQYKIKFPLPAPLPKLTQIIYNNRVICSGMGDIGPLVTSIKLEHKLYTQYAGQQQTNSPDYQAFNSDDSVITMNSNKQILNQFGGSLNMFNPFNNEGGKNMQKTTEYNIPKIPNTPSGNFGQFPSDNTSKEPISTIAKEINQPINEICGRVHPQFAAKPLVVGGDEISRGSWPWLAAVYLNLPSSLSFQCGGNLVSSRVVVTAAHCFFLHNKRYTKNEATIILGRYNIRNWSEDGYIIKKCRDVHLHPDYSDNLKSFDADIAVVVLEDQVKFTEYIRPVCLWSGSSSISHVEGQSGIVVGWGRNENGDLVSSQPRKVETTIVSDTVCLRSNEQFRLLTSNRTFCAGNKDGAGPCTGDSGGGLMIFRNDRWTLRGTVSASLSDPIKNTCNLDEFVIYVDIAKFVDWIYSFMIS